MLRRNGQRGQALLIVLTFIATFALILGSAALFVSGSFKAQGGVVADTKATYAVDAALQWGLAYIRINSLTCAAGTVSPPIPSPGPTVNGYAATVTISPDASCTVGAPVFNLTAQAGSRTGQAQVALVGSIPGTYLQGASSGGAFSWWILQAFPASVVAGHTVIVALAVKGATVAAVADSTFTPYARAVANTSSDGTEVSIWYAQAAASGALTVAAGFSGLATVSAIAIHEYIGLIAAPLDQVAGAAGSSTPVSSGATPATTQASELVFGAVGDSRTGVTYSLGTGFTGRQSTSVNADIATEDKVVSATGTQTANFRASAGGTRWSCVVATFKAAGSAGGWALNSYLLK
jgi:hypothetical protein